MSKMKPLIKYPGGKEKELKQIKINSPKEFNKYYEPFVGGGAYYFSLDSNKYYINDVSVDLINFYKYVKAKNKKFFAYLKLINNDWRRISKYCESKKQVILKMYLKNEFEDFISVSESDILKLISPELLQDKEEYILVMKKSYKSKYNKTHKLEQVKGKLSKPDIFDNMKSSIKAGYYTYLRNLYNTPKISKTLKSALFVFFREYCYSSMFRYNANGEFNVPYGGISYNEKYLSKKINEMLSQNCYKKLSKTIVSCDDFYKFLKKYKPTKKDFIFLDPPYDTEFSKYDNNEFNRKDQRRLRDYLVNECKAKWLLVIKNTEFIYNLYNSKKLNIVAFDKTYNVSFKNRNNRKCEHLLIKNY